MNITHTFLESALATMRWWDKQKEVGVATIDTSQTILSQIVYNPFYFCAARI